MKISKIILGAKNSDWESIKEIIKVYSLAGAKVFDLCADAELLAKARNLIVDLQLETPPKICASITLKNDIHAKKAKIVKGKCLLCGNCNQICPQKAIEDFVVKTKKCTGCRLCEKNCPNNAIDIFDFDSDFEEQFIQAKTADFIEIHTNGKDKNLLEVFEFLKENYKGEIGICISNNENDAEKIEIIEKVKDIIAPKILIVQADGASISGFANDSTTTEKALLECAKYSAINGIKLIISGGTNAMTFPEAVKRGLKFDGVAWGSFARKIITDNQNKKIAIKQAKELIAPLKR